MIRIKKFITGATIAIGALSIGALPLASTGASALSGHGQPEVLQANLSSVPLNGANASGVAVVRLSADNQATVRISANGLLKNAPHAQHFHFDVSAAHICPTASSDTNNDGKIDGVEAAPDYGAIQTSLTTTGDTSPASSLAVDRFPTYDNGYYERTIQLSDAQAEQVRSGQVVIVLHGIDSIKPDGVYDGAPRSPIAASAGLDLPLEAVAPAICGVLETTQSPDLALSAFSSSFTANSASFDSATMQAGMHIVGQLQPEQRAPFGQFRSQYFVIHDAFDAATAQNKAQFQADIAQGLNKDVAKDQFINRFNHAKDVYLNQYETARNQLIDGLNREGVGAPKDQFVASFSSYKDTFANQLNAAKDSFAQEISNL